MRKYCLLSGLCIATTMFAADMYDNLYLFSCTVSNANTKQVIKTLPGQLEKTAQLATLSQANLESTASGVLSTNLCIESGFSVQGTLTNIPSIPNSNSSRGVKVLQQYPSPACAVTCKLLSPPQK